MRFYCAMLAFLILMSCQIVKAQDIEMATSTQEMLQIEPAAPVLPKIDEPAKIVKPAPKIKDFRTEEVVKSTPGGIALEGIRIDISLDKQRLRVIEDYKVLYEFKTSTGKHRGSTPKGVMRVYNHALNPISRKYKCHLYRWLAVTPNGSIGIHGLFMSGYEKKLGSPASHGCIRLSRPNAEIVYNWAVKHKKETGTYPQVYIY